MQTPTSEPPLVRVLEPEVMDSAEEASDYDSMDHSEVNRRFVDHLLEFHARTKSVANDPVAGSLEQTSPFRVLDVGTGTAQIPIELSRRGIPMTVTAIDLASHMLKLGQANVDQAGLTASIRLELIDAKHMPYADGSFDWGISNSIIHHIPEPLGVLREMLRVLRPGGLLFIRDLLRPADQPTLDKLVQTYAGNANPHQRQMFDDSLHAALSLAEVQEMLQMLNRPSEWVTQSSDRHWTIAAIA